MMTWTVTGVNYCLRAVTVRGTMTDMADHFGNRMKAHRVAQPGKWGYERAAMEAVKASNGAWPVTISKVRTIERCATEEECPDRLAVIALLIAYGCVVADEAPYIASQRETLTGLLDPSHCLAGTAA